MARYAINMETGVVVGMTSETLGNYVYQEIEPRVALAIENGRISPKSVIDQIMDQMPRTGLREKIAQVARQNVRQSDFGLKEAARASVDMGPSRVVKVQLPGEDAPAPTPEERKAADLAAKALEQPPPAPSQDGATPAAPPPEDHKPAKGGKSRGVNL